MNKMSKKLQKVKSKKGGFTLIELIVVIAIIGILAAIMLPKFAGFTDSAKKSGASTDAKHIYTAIESMKLDPEFENFATSITEDKIKVFLGADSLKGKMSASITSPPATKDNAATIMFTYAYKHKKDDVKQYKAICYYDGRIVTQMQTSTSGQEVAAPGLDATVAP